MAEEEANEFNFAISLSVLNHLGRNLYRNFITVLGEAISNSWDADAKNVWIDFNKDTKFFTIKDDGDGMDANSFQNKFLKIGYSKRKDGDTRTENGRPYIGAKGIGKLALLSCAKKVTIFSKKAGENYIGGLIDNSGLDEAITDNLNPDEYPLEEPDIALIDGLSEGHDKGTIIAFEGADEVLRVTEEQIKKLLAMSFHFSLIDPEFTIHVNGEPINVADLTSLAESTQFLWRLAEYDDDFLRTMENLKKDVTAPETKLPISGYIASVAKPSNLKVRGAEDVRASVDLFVNGRMREKNVLRHIPTQRLVENYIYGQIHFDEMDGDGDSPFTSSREGIVETDPNFEALIIYLRRTLMPKVIDQWDEFRLANREEGDDENPRKTTRQRKAASLVAAAESEFTPTPEDGDEDDLISGWLKGLQDDAEYNVSAYVDCFLSENLVRKFLEQSGLEITDDAKKNVTKYRNQEENGKGKANISFAIRANESDLGFLSMYDLAESAEGSKKTDGKQSLWSDAIQFAPARNAVGHTGLLTDDAKHHLNGIFRNIRGRVRTLFKE